MLPPYELKNKEFSKSMRGYNTAEVDEHISFIIEKYTELYRENDELERKLKTAYAKLDEIKNEEESIRNAMINAQRASSKLMTEANDRADIIINTARKSCDRILADFRTKIQEERAVLIALNSAITEFKEKLFKLYSSHIANIEDIPTLEADEIAKFALSDESYTSAVVQNIKQEIINVAASNKVPTKSIDEVDEGFVVADPVSPDNTVRSNNVKDTIKELNKRFLDEHDDPVGVNQVVTAPVSEEEKEEDSAYGEILKQLGATGAVDLEFVENDLSSRRNSKSVSFEDVYKTPDNYGDTIKKGTKNQ